MYEAIVVSLDGSRLAERALPMAAAVATRLGARLVLVRVLEAGAALDRLSARATAEDYLAGVACKLALEGVSADARVLEGDAADAIRAAVATEGAGLVVMTTHGRSGLGRWLYGSVTWDVLAATLVPVVVVRALGAPEQLPLRWRGRPVLVGLDGSAAAEHVVPHAAGLAGALGGALILLSVVTVAPAPTPELAGILPSHNGARAADESAHAQARMDALAGDLARRGLRVDTRLRRATSPAEAILAEASRAGAGLVALGCHGRTGLSRLPFGSVTHEVLHQAGVPLLLVRAPASE